MKPERLTWKSGIDGYEDVGLRKGVTVGDAVCQLADYEDSGLTPGEVMKMKESPNDPLTLEELREMDGEPVWVVPIPHVGQQALKSEYALVNVAKERFCTSDSSYWCFIACESDIIVYRRRPK